MMRASCFSLVLLLTACAGKPQEKPAQQPPPATLDKEATAFLAEQVPTLAGLDKTCNLAWYDASVSGTDEAWKKSADADAARDRFLADPERFKKLQTFREAGKIADEGLKRQLDVLYLWMLAKQVDPATLDKITALQKKVEQAFNTFRGKVDGKEITQNQVNEILRGSTDSKKLKAAWEAQKAVGPMVAADLKEIVLLRNEVAKKLGYRDFYALSIAQAEQDETKVLAIFDELDKLTREPFLKAKEEVDKRLAKRLKVKPAELMPWHYQNAFFQEPPDVFTTGLDAVYKKQDTLALAKTFFTVIGLDTEPVVQRSDLFEKKDKTPHAFEVNIDRTGDVRILANIVPGAEWQETVIHELGHAVYDVYLGKDLPWLLQEAAHPLTTEGIAMMLGGLVGEPRWAEAMGVIDVKTRDKVLPEARLRDTFASLQFSRWTQVMLRFERAMYENPEQDLNKLWWDLVEEYQAIKRPKDRNAPDYASKIHLVVAPVYYHNYMLGQLFASQVHEAIALTLAKPVTETVFVNEPKVGEFLKTKVFGPGRRLHFEALTVEATGKPLSAEAFARSLAEP
jgi:peptidyl-dipeptidase A